MANMLWEVVKTSKGFVDQAAGQSEVLTAVFDMQDFDEIEFEVFVGDSTSGSVVTYAVKENTASSTSSPTPTAVALTTVSAGALTSGNLVTTAGASDIDDKIIRICVARQSISKRYVFLSVTPATQNTAFNGCTVHQRRSRAEPITQSSDVYAYAYAAV